MGAVKGLAVEISGKRAGVIGFLCGGVNINGVVLVCGAAIGTGFCCCCCCGGRVRAGQRMADGLGAIN